MNNIFLQFRKEIKAIEAKILSNEFVYSDEGNEFSHVKEAMKSSIDIRNNIIDVLLSMNDNELLASINFIFGVVLSNKGFLDDLFKMSFIKFIVYEICLYLIANLLILGKYELLHKIVSKQYYVINYTSFNEISFYSAIMLKHEHTCNLRLVSNSKEDFYSIFDLLNNRLNNSIASMEELKSADLYINDCAVLANEEYDSYLQFVRDNPTLMTIIGKMIQSNDETVFPLFGFENKEELKNATGDIMRRRRLLGIGRYIA